MREPGFYWVKSYNEENWEILYYDIYGIFHNYLGREYINESDFSEIDERRIVREEKPYLEILDKFKPPENA
jgi:hypothetical protein